MEITLLLLPLVAVLVVPDGDVEVEVVVVPLVDVILEDCWDLHRKPSGSVNQVSSQEDSPATSGPPTISCLALDFDLISIPRDEYAQFLAHKWVSSPSTTTLARSSTASQYLFSSTLIIILLIHFKVSLSIMVPSPELLVPTVHI